MRILNYGVPDGYRGWLETECELLKDDFAVKASPQGEWTMYSPWEDHTTIPPFGNLIQLWFDKESERSDNPFAFFVPCAKDASGETGKFIDAITGEEIFVNPGVDHFRVVSAVNVATYFTFSAELDGEPLPRLLGYAITNTIFSE